MGLGNFCLLLLVVSSFTASRTAADFLTPIISPILNATCEKVECGRGTCNFSLSHTFGFVCNCNPGWSQLHINDGLRFLPCIIPNCSINYSCFKDSEPPVPAPPPPPTNISVFDPCRWSYCSGGSCVKTSTFKFRCECNSGYGNLLNISSFPCYQQCALGADCANLGVTISNSSSSSGSPPTNQSDNGSSSRSAWSPEQLVWFCISATIYLLMAHAT